MYMYNDDDYPHKEHVLVLGVSMAWRGARCFYSVLPGGSNYSREEAHRRAEPPLI